ncbi:MAG: beta-ketoacyl-[acyl-carrier-protein] synthase family protein, partial [Terriglobales bacterium]
MTAHDATAVVITGVGVVSPLGNGCAANAAALRGGQSGIRPIAAFDAHGFPVQCAGEVPQAELARGGGRPEALARMALHEALSQAALATAADPRRAFSFAIGKPTLDLPGLARGRAQWQAQGDPAAALEALPHLEVERTRAEPPALLQRMAHAAGAAGPRFSCYTACASGNDAIGLGLRLIQRGEADVVITGGTDCQVHPLSLLEFELLSALSHESADRACRPFDRGRSGFVVGEGAAALVLESAAHARRRGARPLARLAGYGSSLDAFGLTKCHPQGRGAALAMRAALADAGLAPGDVDYLNAHGTGTVL